MLRKSLERRLRKTAAQWQVLVDEDLRLAEAAKLAGDCRQYFARSYLSGVPSLYWVLEEYDTARFYYRLGAERQVEERAWYEVHDPAFPINADLLGEAELYLRAGLLERAKEFLRRAHQQEVHKPEPNPTGLRRIALAAAQVGQVDLVHAIHDAARMRVSGLNRCRELTRRAGQLMHEIGPAEVAFLLGDYEECRRRLESVLEAEQLVRRHRIRVPYIDGQTGVSLIFAKASGLYIALQLTDPHQRHREIYEHALQYFERAIDRARALGDLSWEGYQARLYARLACDLLGGRQPNPNPFVHLPSKPE